MQKNKKRQLESAWNLKDKEKVCFHNKDRNYHHSLKQTEKREEKKNL
jgi:hypothetical protein